MSIKKDGSFEINHGLLEMTKSLVKVDQNVEFIKDQMTTVKSDTREARDKARQALGLINLHLRNKSAHEHPCIELTRQENQDSDIADIEPVIGNLVKLEPRLNSLSKLVWWALGAFLAILISLGGFALQVNSDSVQNSILVKKHEKDLENFSKRSNEFNNFKVVANTVLNQFEALVDELEDNDGDGGESD